MEAQGAHDIQVVCVTGVQSVLAGDAAAERRRLDYDES